MTKLDLTKYEQEFHNQPNVFSVNVSDNLLTVEFTESTLGSEPHNIIESIMPKKTDKYIADITIDPPSNDIDSPERTTALILLK